MKKLFISILLLIPSFMSVSILAQKSYVVVSRTGSSSTKITGDVPSDMYSSTDDTPAVVINKLAQRGYIVESVSMTSNEKYLITLYLLSKNLSNTNNSIQQVRADDEEIHEVARYNLQGMAIPPTEKGIQIIVYSNYTTKTVIVE